MARSGEPPLVSGLERGEIHVYEVPELGWSVPYSAEELVATVYIYPREAREDERSALAWEFRSAELEMLQASSQRGFEVVALAKSPGRVDPVRLDPAAVHGSFLLRANSSMTEGSRFSEILVAAARDRFVKVRTTYTSEKPKKSGRAINDLLAALRSMF